VLKTPPWHGGKNTGFTSLSKIYPHLGIGYVFLVNNDDARKMENIINSNLIEGKAALKDLRFVAHREINLDPRVYNAYAGRYKIAHDTVVTVTREGNRLMAEPTDDSKFELFPNRRPCSSSSGPTTPR